MTLDRRQFLSRVLAHSAAGSALALVFGLRGERLEALPDCLERQGLKIGGCDWSLGLPGDPAAFALARAAGLEGVEVSCGKPIDGALPLLDEARQKALLDAAKAQGIEITSTCLEVLHRDGLKAHAEAPEWIRQALRATSALGAGVILLPMFFEQAIEKRSEQESVAKRLATLAPEAEKAGIVLGLEDSISARDNAWILDQVKSKAVQVYYDVANSLRWKHDVYSEVSWLGKDRVCAIHLKDSGYLGAGEVDLPRFLEDVLKSEYRGWLNLETRIVENARDDFKRNAAFVRGLLEKARAKE